MTLKEFARRKRKVSKIRSWRYELRYARAFGHVFNFKLIDG